MRAENRTGGNADIVLEIRDLHKRFGSTPVLRGIELQVRKSEVVVVLGPSGSGKSTLLRCINFLEKYDSGEVRLNGSLIGYRETGRGLEPLKEPAIAAQRREIGMVFQRFNLFAHFTALENITEALVHVQGASDRDAKEVAEHLLKRVGLVEKATAYPAQLSGGQQQRIAICRALALRPTLMLFDEPTSALDPEMIGEVLTVMEEVADEGMTMVVVSHEISFAREAADRIVMMEDGVLIEDGTPHEVLDNPQHERTKAFLSKVL